MLVLQPSGSWRSQQATLDPSQLYIKANFESMPTLDQSQLWIKASFGSKPTLDPSQLWIQANFGSMSTLDPIQLWIAANIGSKPTLDPCQLQIHANFGYKPLGSKATLKPRKLGSSALTTRKSGSTTGFCAAMFTFLAFNLYIGSWFTEYGSWLLVDSESGSRLGFGWTKIGNLLSTTNSMS